MYECLAEFSFFPQVPLAKTVNTSAVSMEHCKRPPQRTDINHLTVLIKVYQKE